LRPVTPEGQSFKSERLLPAVALGGLIAGGLAWLAGAAGFAATLPPVAGAVAQELIDVAVIANALRAQGTGRR